MKRSMLFVGLLVALVAFASAAGADSQGPITFESPDYTVGNINGQNGWMKTGPYDVAVAPTSRYDFGAQALRLSDAVTSGSFGDQTFSPGLLNAAGESPGYRLFNANFSIGTTLDTEQTGLHMSVSPDDGSGGRMSYLRFEDQSDGIHVYFDDATNPGPVGTETTWNETDVATLDRVSAHTIGFSIHFNPGPANDWVKIYVDGKKVITGTTWEDYYRYDPEQYGNGNQVPLVSKLLFRESGTAHPANAGQGFLVDNLSFSSATIPKTD